MSEQAEEWAGEDAYQERIDAVFMPERGEEISAGVGDVRSEERGSGARFNTGKAPLDLIPVSVLNAWAEQTGEGGYIDDWSCFFPTLDAWQRGDTPAQSLLAFFSLEDLEEAAHVLDYGRRKYAAWNWAKGMPWSVPLGCLLRHELLYRGEVRNAESGRTHRGHTLCNVIMLVHFEDTYPEGDDRPPAACWGGAG